MYVVHLSQQACQGQHEARTTSDGLADKPAKGETNECQEHTHAPPSRTSVCPAIFARPPEELLVGLFSPCTGTVPGSSQSNKACCFLQLESLSLHRASSLAAYSSNPPPTGPTVELFRDAWAF